MPLQYIDAMPLDPKQTGRKWATTVPINDFTAKFGTEDDADPGPDMKQSRIRPMPKSAFPNTDEIDMKSPSGPFKGLARPKAGRSMVRHVERAKSRDAMGPRKAQKIQSAPTTSKVDPFDSPKDWRFYQGNGNPPLKKGEKPTYDWMPVGTEDDVRSKKDRYEEPYQIKNQSPFPYEDVLT